MSKNNWTREEHILAFNLYCKIPFSKINANYPPVKRLAATIGRTDGSVAMKLANFARLDPTLQARGISGLKGGAKGEEEIWNEFNQNWDELGFESERILAKFKGQSIIESVEIIKEEFPEGLEREAVIKMRVNQYLFRAAVLTAYNYKCCITGISIPELLVAGHIVPWSVDTKNRTHPSNGLCLNSLHDKAFDKGLITVDIDYKVQLSGLIKKNVSKEVAPFFIPFENKRIMLPEKFMPSKEFLQYHNNNVFKG